jgi:DNA invertase Pin-like site-specific DNA recombinase
MTRNSRKPTSSGPSSGPSSSSSPAPKKRRRISTKAEWDAACAKNAARNVAKQSNRAAFYVRVSTDEQTTANQIPDLQRFADARGLVLFQQYEETISAGAPRRLSLDQMLEGAHAGHFDVLVIWALDRLSRKMTEVLEIMRKLDAAGVRVLSVRESWLDMSGPTRDLLLAVFGWVAEQERTRLGERTRAGLARARAQGKRLGRPRRVVALELPHLLELQAEGLSVRAMAQRLKVPASTVGRALQRAKLASNGAGE